MRRFTAALALALCFAAPGFAQRAMVVVELYTSQGCSSCPPADALLHDLAEREDVIALALHVDYWDYIGWKDEFAHPQHAQRQRAYAQKAKRRSIYTPEFIVQGQTDVVGALFSNAPSAAHTPSPSAMRFNKSRRDELWLCIFSSNGIFSSIC